jgi:hypothetical protein
MKQATHEQLATLRSRIERLEQQAHGGAASARSRMQRHLDTLREDEESAYASVQRGGSDVDQQLEQLENGLGIAEHRVAAELADDRRQFTAAVEAELDGWDRCIERMQAIAATRTGAARERAEQVIADLRRRRIAAAESLAGVRAATGEEWRGAKKRVLAALDELTRKADAAWRG